MFWKQHFNFEQMWGNNSNIVNEKIVKTLATAEERCYNITY